MVTKTLTITQEAYDFLKRHKGEEQSFSETILSFKGAKDDLLKYVGMLSSKQAIDLHAHVRQTRRDADERLTRIHAGR